MSRTERAWMRYDSPSLVLLPGLDGTGDLFRPLLQELPSELHAEVIAYPPENMTLEEYARFVAERLPSGDHVLLAESFSGLVALQLLADISPAIRGVIFCGGFAAPPRPWLLRLARRLPFAGSIMRAAPTRLLRRYCVGRWASTDQVGMLRKALNSVPPGILAHRLKIIANPPMFRGPFSVPCCYLQGSRDRLVPSASAKWFAEHFSVFDLKVIDGPHFLLQARPRQCAHWIAEKTHGLLRRGTAPLDAKAV